MTTKKVEFLHPKPIEEERLQSIAEESVFPTDAEFIDGL